MTGIDPQLMRQLLETFRGQLGEQLQVISEGLLRLEQGDTDKARSETLNNMFRACHNVKGAARGIGLGESSTLAHTLENLFGSLRDQRIGMQPGLVDLCLRTLDLFPVVVDGEIDQRPLPPELTELMALLGTASAGKPLPELGALNVQTHDSAVQGSIRLPVKRLDRIAARSDELQVARLRIEDHLALGRMVEDFGQQLRQLWAQLMAQPASTWDGAGEQRRLLAEGSDLVLELSRLQGKLNRGLRTTVSQLRPLVSGLHDEVRDLRMVPASSLLLTLERVVRDVAQNQDKQVELHLHGSELVMDRAILDALRNPLTHLLRNAVDHGLEPVAQRRARNKPDTGHITLQLARNGGLVHLTIEDDGHGIDLRRVRNRVLEQKLATAEEIDTFTEEQLLDHLFRPGFTTRSEADEYSGRGVGLDVVRVNLQAINGRVSVHTRSGEGTRFSLEVPLTMAADKGLVVRSGGQLFAIPSQYVHRILELDPGQVRELEGTQVINVDGEPVPLSSLVGLLQSGDSAPQSGDRLEVVVVSLGWRRLALLVDRLLEEREMVIKPLSPPLGQVPKVSGGTLGRDGGVILVLEVADLFKAPRGSAQVVVTERSGRHHASARILVVDDSITTRTLEVGILENAGYRVDSAADGSIALEKLRQHDYQLVVTDVEMPSMDGIELTRRIRHDLGRADLPVVILTSLGSEEDRRRGMEVQADAYIVKSEFDSQLLLETVEQLL